MSRPHTFGFAAHYNAYVNTGASALGWRRVGAAEPGSEMARTVGAAAVDGLVSAGIGLSSCTMTFTPRCSETHTSRVRPTAVIRPTRSDVYVAAFTIGARMFAGTCRTSVPRRIIASMNTPRPREARRCATTSSPIAVGTSTEKRTQGGNLMTARAGMERPSRASSIRRKFMKCRKSKSIQPHASRNIQRRGSKLIPRRTSTRTPNSTANSRRTGRRTAAPALRAPAPPPAAHGDAREHR